MRTQFAHTEKELRLLPSRLPATPRAILVVSGHWEAAQFTVSTASQPPMEYDYSGFPEHTYHIQYRAPGSPAVAGEVGNLLAAGGFQHREDPRRGFDHGTFVPLLLMYPQADVPVVMLSLKNTLDAAEHVRLGELLAPLREDGALIMGSGLTYHNMRGFGHGESTAVANEFGAYLDAAITSSDPRLRDQMLIDWQSAPSARRAHPRADHLIPLMVAAGAAGKDVGRVLFVDHVMAVAMASYIFGEAQPQSG